MWIDGLGCTATHGVTFKHSAILLNYTRGSHWISEVMWAFELNVDASRRKLAPFYQQQVSQFSHIYAITIHANSPGLSGSLTDVERISRSPVRVTKSPGWRPFWTFLYFKTLLDCVGSPDWQFQFFKLVAPFLNAFLHLGFSERAHVEWEWVPFWGSRRGWLG